MASSNSGDSPSKVTTVAMAGVGGGGVAGAKG